MDFARHPCASRAIGCGRRSQSSRPCGACVCKTRFAQVARAAPPCRARATGCSPLWPAAIILEGSLCFVSAALAVHEAALEAVLQSYCAELWLATKATAHANMSKASAAPAGYGSAQPSAQQMQATFGTLATSGPSYYSPQAAAPTDEGLETLPQVPPSYATVPLAASALAGA